LCAHEVRLDRTELPAYGSVPGVAVREKDPKRDCVDPSIDAFSMCLPILYASTSANRDAGWIGSPCGAAGRANRARTVLSPL